ncbi:MAG TPA: DUF6600 domain-containing protein [Candidatus Acidoferrum sp.]|nr:DUF6600 domain-containing protein [Candidatus Acidoferrum sp.]
MRTKCLLAAALVAVLPFSSMYAQAPAAPNLSPAAAEVARLAGAGTSEDVVLAFVQNSQAPFNLTADHVLYLKDVGVPSAVVAAMLNHDSAFRAQAPAPVAERPQPAAAPVPMAAPAPEPGPAAPAPAPPAPVAVSTPPADVGYFYNDLSPYGTWVDMPGYGWCWQPAVVSTVVGWRPYCHGGHWAWTDGGWFWASDYSWGWAAFHYGRWQLHPTAGWVWFPARQWAPAWVVWRSGGDACGWAPLPLHADFVVGGGWRFNGVAVSASFDFGLSVGCFSFVSVGHLCDANIHTYCLPPARVTAIYHTTTVINNYTVVNNTFVNHGINVAVVEKAYGRQFERVSIHDYKAGPGGGNGLVFRRTLGTPAPLHTLSATKLDTHGHINPSSTTFYKLSNNTAAGTSGKPGNGGTQATKFTPTGTKTVGATHNFSNETLNNNTHPTYSTGSSTKLTTTGHTGTLSGNSTTAGSSSSTLSHYGTTTGAGSNLKLNQGSATSSGSGSGNQWSATDTHKPLHPEDVRGASSLTLRDKKTATSSTSGSSANTYSGSSGSSYQHSTGGSSGTSSSSKGSSGSNPNKGNQQ